MSIPPTLVTFTEFHLFPELTVELRLRIWAMPIQPRIIQPRFSEDPKCSLYKFKDPIPPLLHVNSESRKEGLRHYILSLQRGDAMNQFYLNPEIDTIYVSSKAQYGNQFWPFIRGKDCGLWDKVQNLAVDDNLPASDELLQFSALRNYTFVSCQFQPPQECSSDDTECNHELGKVVLEHDMAVKERFRLGWDTRNYIAGLNGFEVAPCPNYESEAFCGRKWGTYSALSHKEIQKFRALNPSSNSDVEAS